MFAPAVSNALTRSGLQNAIVFLDEPERNLHPAVAVEVVTRIREAIGPDGQLWIATHCPAIVAHFGLDSVYKVEDHSVTFAGSRVDHVMEGLLGGTEARRSLGEFFADADHLAVQKYFVQSLFEPGVVGHAEGDAQEIQFSQVVKNLLERSGKPALRVLDYGAGRGRFVTAMLDLPESTRRAVEYFAYNETNHGEHNEQCLRAIAQLHPADAEHRLSANLGDLVTVRWTWW